MLKNDSENIKPLVTKGWDLVSYNEQTLPILTINMTGRCNLKCIYCHTNAGAKDPYELTSQEHINNIDQAADMGTKVLWIAGKGEPLLDPAFRNVVQHAAKKDLVTILNTNGTIIDREMAEFLYDNNVNPEVKLISFDNDAYDFLSDTTGQLKRLEAGLDNLLAAGYGTVEETADSRMTRIAGMMLLAEPAYVGMPMLFRYCNDHNINPVISNLVPAGRMIDLKNYDNLRVSNSDNRRMYTLGSDIMGYPLDTGAEDCHIRYGIFIENDGSIVVNQFGMSCDIQYGENRVIVGNSKEIKLEQAWEKILDMRVADNVWKTQKKMFGSCETGIRAIEHYLTS